MEPVECEFLAESEIIGIIPKFNDNRIIHLIAGDFGPFRAGIPVNVPLWVALSLRRKQKCAIVPPDWMDVQVLEEKLEEEKNNRFFTKMPSDHYMEISHLLLSHAFEDIRNGNRVRTAIKDLWDLRILKARTSAETFLKSDNRHAGIDYLTQLEIGTMRPFLTDTLDAIQYLTPPAVLQNQAQASQRSLLNSSFGSSFSSPSPFG